MTVDETFGQTAQLLPLQSNTSITYNPTYLTRKESNGWLKVMKLLKDECVTTLCRSIKIRSFLYKHAKLEVLSQHLYK